MNYLFDGKKNIDFVLAVKSIIAIFGFWSSWSDEKPSIHYKLSRWIKLAIKLDFISQPLTLTLPLSSNNASLICLA
jgi:hypothetical protein